MLAKFEGGPKNILNSSMIIVQMDEMLSGRIRQQKSLKKSLSLPLKAPVIMY